MPMTRETAMSERPEVTFDIEQKDIPAYKGVPIVLQVAGSGTTGYLWEVEAEAGSVRIHDHRIAADEESFGAAGTESFVVELLENHDAELRFILKAPWEEQPAEVHTVTLRHRDRSPD